MEKQNRLNTEDMAQKQIFVFFYMAKSKKSWDYMEPKK